MFNGGPGNWPLTEITGLVTPATVLLDQVKVIGKKTVAADAHWARQSIQMDRISRRNFIFKLLR